MITSKIRPRAQRTSLASREGGSCMCMPRTVPRRRFRDMLDCTNGAGSPWAANSRWHHSRANEPRSSLCGAVSSSKAPANGVSLKRKSAPEKLRVDLVRGTQVLQLFEAREGAEPVPLIGHLDTLEQLAQLPRAVPRRVLRREARQFAMDAIEVDAVAPIVATRRPHCHFATRELFGDDLRDVTNTIVFTAGADIEYLAADRVRRRHQRSVNGFANVEHVHERAPGAAIAHHRDPLGGPCDSAEIVQQDVESHAW